MKSQVRTMVMSFGGWSQADGEGWGRMGRFTWGHRKSRKEVEGEHLSPWDMGTVPWEAPRASSSHTLWSTVETTLNCGLDAPFQPGDYWLKKKNLLVISASQLLPDANLNPLSPPLLPGVVLPPSLIPSITPPWSVFLFLFLFYILEYSWVTMLW